MLVRDVHVSGRLRKHVAWTAEMVGQADDRNERVRPAVVRDVGVRDLAFAQDWCRPAGHQSILRPSTRTAALFSPAERSHIPGIQAELVLDRRVSVADMPMPFDEKGSPAVR